MKKFLFIFLIILLTSCVEEKRNERGEIIYEKSFSEPHIGDKITYIIFEKHRYVKFESGHRGSITHDPDCPYCKSKNEEE